MVSALFLSGQLIRMVDTHIVSVGDSVAGVVPDAYYAFPERCRPSVRRAVLLRHLPLLSKSAAIAEETMEKVYHRDRYDTDRILPYLARRRGLLRRWTLVAAHPSLRNRRITDRRCPGLEAVPATPKTGKRLFDLFLNAVDEGAYGSRPVIPLGEVSAVDVLLGLGIGLTQHPGRFVDLSKRPHLP